MPNFTPKQLNPKELEQKERQFQEEVFGDPDEMEKVFKNLHDFFKGKSPETDYKYYDSHFRWYTEVSWKRLRARNKNFMSDIAVPRQIFLATLLGYDVTDKLLTYLRTESVDENEMQSLYNDIQNGFENSSAIIYSDKEETMTVSDLITKFKTIRKKDDYSLEQAKLFTEIKDQVSDTEWFEYKFIEFEDVLEKLEEMSVFVERADIDTIYYIADAYLFPERYEEFEEEGEAAESVIEGETTTPTPAQTQTTTQSDQTQPEKELGQVNEEKNTEEISAESTEETTEEKKVEDMLEGVESTTEEETEPEESGEVDSQADTDERSKKTEAEKPQEAAEIESQPKPGETKKTEATEGENSASDNTIGEILDEEESKSSTSQNKEEQTTEKQKEKQEEAATETKEESEESSDMKTEEDQGQKKEENQEQESKKEADQSTSRHDKKAKETIEKHKGMSNEEIKEEVESQFGKLRYLDPENIDNFQRVLKNIARQEDREDEVNDWFYFDQESGNFKWNI